VQHPVIPRCFERMVADQSRRSRYKRGSAFKSDELAAFLLGGLHSACGKGQDLGQILE
jgi:hypothetical protein